MEDLADVVHWALDGSGPTGGGAAPARLPPWAQALGAPGPQDLWRPLGSSFPDHQDLK
jgi:hypothetical protein